MMRRPRAISPTSLFRCAEGSLHKTAEGSSDALRALHRLAEDSAGLEIKNKDNRRQLHELFADR
jgi:hypothetical protein